MKLRKLLILVAPLWIVSCAVHQPQGDPISISQAPIGETRVSPLQEMTSTPMRMPAVVDPTSMDDPIEAQATANANGAIAGLVWAYADPQRIAIEFTLKSPAIPEGYQLISMYPSEAALQPDQGISFTHTGSYSDQDGVYHFFTPSQPLKVGSALSLIFCQQR